MIRELREIAVLTSVGIVAVLGSLSLAGNDGDWVNLAIGAMSILVVFIWAAKGVSKP